MGDDPIAALRGARLPAAWFARDALEVAPDLIGTVLVHKRRAGVIVETEAYLGSEDLASHARFGPTSRTSVMFGPGGVSYVYLCYGIHEMFNIVTGVEGRGQAVLIRAIAPHVGLPDDPHVGRGPGKVTKALAIDRSLDRKDLARGPLFVARGVAPPEVATGPRVGVAYAEDWAARPYRFWWRGHPSVSRPAAAGASRGKDATIRKR
ncbi:MAG TPA: DNA-3-methyladenine glycosylase [Kofleriaceae bacterium]|nr:DNA-3-methyladenine glycosylase [Kofleriaceae bacterium]